MRNARWLASPILGYRGLAYTDVASYDGTSDKSFPLAGDARGSSGDGRSRVDSELDSGPRGKMSKQQAGTEKASSNPG